MLRFKLKEVLNIRGYMNAHKWLMTIGGMNPASATKILNGKQNSLKLEHISRICANLDCAPNDILYWEDTKKYNLAPTHSLHTQLKPPPNISDWETLLKNMTPEQVAELYDEAQVLLAKHEAEKEAEQNTKPPTT